VPQFLSFAGLNRERDQNSRQHQNQKLRETGAGTQATSIFGI